MVKVAVESEVELVGNRAARCLWNTRLHLGETPIWVPATAGVQFIDGLRGELLGCTTKGAARRRRQVAPELGFAALADGDRRVLGVGTELVLAAADGSKIRSLGHAPGDPRKLRLNDAGADASGRLWTGTMCRHGRDPAGALYRREPDGELRVIDDGYTIPNGFAFDRAGHTVYVADSPRQTVHAYELDARGLPNQKRVFFAWSDVARGYPDGMAVDAQDHLWIAFYGGACLRRFRPDGSVERELPMPDQNVTACAFGGPDLQTLFVTTAGDPRARWWRPWLHGGSLYTVDPGVAGLPVPAVQVNVPGAARAASQRNTKAYS
jgi:xylono-1,5-lactonase